MGTKAPWPVSFWFEGHDLDGCHEDLVRIANRCVGLIEELHMTVRHNPYNDPVDPKKSTVDPLASMADLRSRVSGLNFSVSIQTGPELTPLDGSKMQWGLWANKLKDLADVAQARSVGIYGEFSMKYSRWWEDQNAPINFSAIAAGVKVAKTRLGNLPMIIYPGGLAKDALPWQVQRMESWLSAIQSGYGVDLCSAVDNSVSRSSRFAQNYCLGHTKTYRKLNMPLRPQIFFGDLNYACLDEEIQWALLRKGALIYMNADWYSGAAQRHLDRMLDIMVGLDQ